LCRAAGFTDSHQSAALRCRKNDVAVGKPDGPERLRRIGDRHRHPTGADDLLQLTRSEESNPSAVVREERCACTIGPGHRTWIELIERPHVETTHRVAC